MNVTDHRTANLRSAPMTPAVSGTDFPTSQGPSASQTVCAGGGPSSATTIVHATPKVGPSLPSDSATPANPVPPSTFTAPGLADPTLQLLSDVLDDLESVRIANENRLRQLTRSVEDKDGEVRGFGLDTSHPAVGKLAEIVAAMAGLEHQATLALQKQIRAHPMGPWVKATRGIGEKQGARLLAVLGDPYIRRELEHEDGTVEPSRPRTVSELWAYCGYKPGQKRRKGVRSNWSAVAKSRAYLIAEAMLKAGNRNSYDARKMSTVGRLHAESCARCGPSGKPAQTSSPWSDGHRHADALRYVAKNDVLKGVWREAKRLHEQVGGHRSCDNQGHPAAG